MQIINIVQMKYRVSQRRIKLRSSLDLITFWTPISCTCLATAHILLVEALNTYEVSMKILFSYWSLLPDLS